MVRREPQLVLFTILTQLSAGLAIVWGLAAFSTFPQDFFLASSVLRPVLVVVLVTLVLGVWAGSLHLAHPGRSHLALANFQHSWLSREALAGLVFGGLVTFLLLISWAGFFPGVATWFLLAAASLAGLGLVGGIARLYMLRTVPAWNHPGTPASFLTTSLLLGTAALQVMYTWFFRQSREPTGWAGYLDWVVVGLVSLQFLVSLSSYVFLSTQGEKAVESLQVVWSSLLPFLIARWVLAFGSTGVLLARAGDVSVLGLGPFGAALLVFGLLLGSEILGRWIFYGTYRREGI